jgi:hypothetical protein
MAGAYEAPPPRARNLVALPPRSPRLLLGLAAGALFVASLIGLTTLPTGADSAADVVPPGSRTTASVPVEDARVLLVERGGRAHIVVAYRRDEGWHAVNVPPPPAGSAAAWAATRGGSGVPALSAVYGKTDGAKVKVEWADGKTADATVGSDHTYLVVRPGHVRSKSVSVLGADGALLSTVEGP